MSKTTGSQSHLPASSSNSKSPTNFRSLKFPHFSLTPLTKKKFLRKIEKRKKNQFQTISHGTTSCLWNEDAPLSFPSGSCAIKEKEHSVGGRNKLNDFTEIDEALMKSTLLEWVFTKSFCKNFRFSQKFAVRKIRFSDNNSGERVDLGDEKSNNEFRL